MLLSPYINDRVAELDKLSYINTRRCWLEAREILIMIRTEKNVESWNFPRDL